MKKANVAFSLALLLAGSYCCATPATARGSVPTQVAITSQVAPTASGYEDGTAFAAQLDQQYGKGTPEYEQALEAERAIAVRHAREVGYDPFYWRAYVRGLDDY